MVDTLTVGIEIDDEREEFELPAGLVGRLSEPGESPPTVVADFAIMSFAGRAHALAHHDEGQPDPELEEIEDDMMNRFEDRFGVTYAEATGHSH